MEHMQLPYEELLDINNFSQTLNKKYLVNSYKLYWFAGLLEEIKQGNNIISFNQIVFRMIAKSWFSLLQFKLNFGIQDKLFLLVNYIYKNSDLKVNSSEADILFFLNTSKDVQIKKKIQHFFKFVPFRFLTPFYSNELKSVPDSQRNTIITRLSQKNPRFYIIENNQIIIIDPWYNYLYKNQAIVDGWLSHKLISFLQARNPNVPAIIEKINPPVRRNLTKVSNFWKEILKSKQISNIYDKTLVSVNDLSIDHFIPWSFVHHDKVWNLVPVSNSINSMKSDKLPDLNTYLNDFIQLHFETYKLVLKTNNKMIEDYLMLPQLDSKTNTPFLKFEKALKSTIYPLHQLAKNQGFQIWKY